MIFGHVYDIMFNIDGRRLSAIFYLLAVKFSGLFVITKGEKQMPKISYMGNGSTTEFNFNFPYYENTDIIVTKNNQTATDFTVIGTSGGENADIPYIGGKVVFDVAPTALDSVTIKRQLPLTRIIDYQPTEKINPTLLNQDMNYEIEVLKDMYTELDDFYSKYARIINQEETETLLARIEEISNEIADSNESINDLNQKIADGQIMSKDLFFSYTSNCLTNISQDIKLELNNGTLILKSGSKVYVPNGDGVFDTVTTTQDLSITISGDGQKFIYKNPGNYINYQAITTSVSGTTDSLSGTPWHLWYDTTNNVINRYGADGTTAMPGQSLPIAIVTVSGGTISSIDQVFNGFGYIGSTVFVLPTVKALAPNGRNADGTLKNTTITATDVSIKTSTTVGSSMILRLYNENILDWDTNSNTYNSALNYNVSNTATPDNCCYVGTITTTTNGQITTFNIKNVFSYIV